MSNATLLLSGALVVGAVAGAVFHAYPEIDIDTSAMLYRGNGVFGGMVAHGVSTPTIEILRTTSFIVYVAACIASTVGLLLTSFFKQPWFGLPSAKWLFFGLCLAVGPGLVGNLVLKNNWGRARPIQIVEFGGTKSYTPPLTPADQCAHNCSFVAGEASTIYVTFFALAFLFPSRGRQLIAAGIVAGSLAGLVRMAQGAHFLSDVIFAGVTMALTTAALYFVFEGTGGMPQAKPDSEVQNPLA